MCTNQSRPDSLSQNNAIFTGYLLTFYAIAQLTVVAGHAFATAGSYTGSTDFPLSSFPHCELVVEILHNFFGYICVPPFFVLSGYLFFKGFDSMRSWRDKLKRRASSLLGPYIIWNLLASPWITAFLIPLVSIAVPTLGQARHVTFTEVFIGQYPAFFPANSPMWYIQQLILMVIIAPLIRVLMKSRYAAAWLVLMLTGWSVTLCFMYGGGENFAEALFCFSCGAYLSIREKSLFTTPRRWLPYLAAGLMAVSCFSAVYDFHAVLIPLMCIPACMMMFGLAKVLASTRHLPMLSWLGEAALFVYFAHILGGRQIDGLLISYLKPQNDVEMFLAILAFIAVTLTIWLSVFALMRRFAPRVLNFLTGGRIRNRSARRVQTAS